jgi:hypothetical protein
MPFKKGEAKDRLLDLIRALLFRWWCRHVLHSFLKWFKGKYTSVLLPLKKAHPISVTDPGENINVSALSIIKMNKEASIDWAALGEIV